VNDDFRGVEFLRKRREKRRRDHQSESRRRKRTNGEEKDSKTHSVLLVHLLSHSGPIPLLLILLFPLRRMPSLILQPLVSLSLDLLVLLQQQVRLQAQHPRHADQRDQQQDRLQRRLSSEELFLGIDGSRREEHVDEHVEETGRRDESGLSPVDGPLVDDADDEVTEDGLHEEELGDEFGVDGHVLFEVDVVGDLEADGEGHLKEGRKERERREVSSSSFRRDNELARRREKRTHVDNSEDDTHLHLVRVGEDESVVRSVPGRVESERVGSVLNR